MIEREWSVEFTEPARFDLFQIWQHVADDHPDAADQLIERIRARCKILRLFPQTGIARPDLGATARMLVERPYLILYSVHRDIVEIVRVVHGARDVISETAGNFE